VKEYHFTLPFPPSSNMAYPTILRGKKPVRVTGEALKKWFAICPKITEKMKYQKCQCCGEVMKGIVAPNTHPAIRLICDSCDDPVIAA